MTDFQNWLSAAFAWLGGVWNSITANIVSMGSFGPLYIIVGLFTVMVFIALLVGTILVFERFRRSRVTGTPPAAAAPTSTASRGPGFFARCFMLIVFAGIVGINYLVLSADMPMINDMLRTVIVKFDLPVNETTLIAKIVIMLIVSIVAYRWITSIVRPARPAQQVSATTATTSTTTATAERGGGLGAVGTLAALALMVACGVFVYKTFHPNTAIAASAPSPTRVAATSSPIRLTAADCNGQGKTYYLARGQEIHNDGLCTSGFDVTGGGAVHEHFVNRSPRTVDVGVRLGESGSRMTKIVATASDTRVFLTLYPGGAQSPNTVQVQAQPGCANPGNLCPPWRR